MPLYKADNQLGYIPAPNQSGAFLHSRQWRFNEYSMGSAAFEPDPRRFNILLVGDSIVLGGNPLNQSDRLGPQLEKLSGWQVWPVSAGSWALQNELAYLRTHPDVLQRVDAVAIVSNSGDFGEPSSWASPVTRHIQECICHDEDAGMDALYSPLDAGAQIKKSLLARRCWSRSTWPGRAASCRRSSCCAWS